MSDRYEQVIGFGDHAGTRFEVAAEPPDDPDGEASVHMAVMAGMCGGRGMPTRKAARQMAAAVLDACDAADEMDERRERE